MYDCLFVCLFVWIPSFLPSFLHSHKRCVRSFSHTLFILQDPSKLKRSFATFLVYARDHLEDAKKASDDKKFGKISSSLAASFKALKEAEMKAVSEKACFSVLKFGAQIEGFVPDDDAPKRKKAKKDPNAPKRNMSAYFLYSMAARADAKKENPDASFGDIARILSGKFKTMSAKEKKKWDTAAEKDKARYEKEMEKYNKTIDN